MTDITIVLNQSQLAKILGASGSSPDIAGRIGGSIDLARLRELEESDNRRLSRSVIRGLMCLAGLPADGSPAGILTIAKTLGISPSTTHRYCATLLAVGLLTQDPRTREYARTPTASKVAGSEGPPSGAPHSDPDAADPPAASLGRPEPS
jgi:hypothetical protein